MKIVYDIEVFKYLNLAGFLTDDGRAFWVVNAYGYPKNTTLQHGLNMVYVNHKDGKHFIETVMKRQIYGVPYGFNNHAYDDFLIDDIAAGISLEFVKAKSDAIIKTRPRMFFEWESYDAKEQMPAGFSLKKWEAMSGLTVDESSIPFDYEGEFTREQLQEVISYNLFDLEATQRLVKERENYFNGKNLLVEEYGYPGARRYSNGSISAHFLMGRDKLDTFVPTRPRIVGVPEDVAAFLNDALTNSPYVSRGKTESERARRKKGMTTDITTQAFGNVFSWGWGGLHSARGEITLTKTGKQRKKYFHETFEDVEQWDVASMFPSIIIRDNLLGTATPKFKKLVRERLKNKKAGNPLAATQKIVVNAVYGLLRLQSSRLFNPHSAIHVNVAGMVAIYNLAERLSKYGTIIQVNTDGIAFKPDKSVPRETFTHLRKEWEVLFGLELEVSHFEKIIQRDVNNYVAVYSEGHLKVKGGSVNRALKNDYTKNTTPVIIQRAVLAALVDGTPVEETVSRGTNLLDYCFTLSAMKGATQTGATIEIKEGQLPRRLENRVNRVYASTDGSTFLKEKTPAPDGSLRPAAQFPDAPTTATLANAEIGSEMPSDIDFAYYTQLAETKLAQWR